MSGIEPWILMAASTAVSTVATVQSANAQANAADYNAKLAEAQGDAEAERRRRAGQRQLSTLRANRAKSGVTMQGTPLLVAAESAAMVELDAANAEWAARSGAGLYRSQARSARRSIPYGVGASLLSGATQYTTYKASLK